VVEFAKKNLGKKYVWGATGPNNFDCSGFTKEVFKCTIGINIPRVSRDQAKVGTYVEFSELRRGDMVFFDTEKKYTGKVNHVGIYLSNNNFIHASSAKKKVIITNFKKKPFYKKRFLWGRRIIKNKS
ncbi:MAG TPA: NlpC/P60 family protein, partial [Campylobacterales bacterium]|nr:NlpC/P60 family protein [Campylobacterales bacterium]